MILQSNLAGHGKSLKQDPLPQNSSTSDSLGTYLPKLSRSLLQKSSVILRRSNHGLPPKNSLKKRWSRFSVPSCIVHSPSQTVGHTFPPSLASRHPSIFHHHPSLKKSPSSAVLSDIQWWRAQLSADFTGSSLARPPPTSTVKFWVDASSSWGIGVVFGNEWDAWQLSPG